ncbi:MULTISPECIES: TraV family lipoprotein [Sphingomonadales]|nr:TraV family lipoprotein [Rhizorhabdus histidinilytica]
MITADAAEGVALPADAAPRSTRDRSRLGSSRRTAATVPADPARTREKVLRIVFQPYIDERGRLHEKSAIHAVVASGEWQQSLAQTVPSNARLDYALGVPESLADAVDRVDPPGGSPGVGDPAAPDPDAVAAARARRGDPLETIKADVAARLAQKQKSPAAAAPADGVAHAPSVTASPAPLSPSGAPAGGHAREPAASAAPPTTISAAGEKAVERVKSDPAYRQIAGSAAKDARDAAADGTPVASKPNLSAPTVRAADFPASVPEDH